MDSTWQADRPLSVTRNVTHDSRMCTGPKARLRGGCSRWTVPAGTVHASSGRGLLRPSTQYVQSGSPSATASPPLTGSQGGEGEAAHHGQYTKTPRAAIHPRRRPQQDNTPRYCRWVQGGGCAPTKCVGLRRIALDAHRQAATRSTGVSCVPRRRWHVAGYGVDARG